MGVLVILAGMFGVYDSAPDFGNFHVVKHRWYSLEYQLEGAIGYSSNGVFAYLVWKVQ